MKYFKWIGFMMIIAAQWYVPGNMILEKERVSRKGVLVKFQTAPVDPHDPFRGKYVSLSFRENAFRQANGTTFSSGQKIFVLLKEDQNGYATIKSISATKPDKGNLFLKALVNYAAEDGMVHIQYPFDRFYMNEYKAPEAERIYNEGRIDSTQKAYALLSVLNGDAVIKDVLINDTSITELVNQVR